LDTLDISWLKEFEAVNGRPLRTLHVGNVANNAFLVAKFLRSVGVEADTLSYDYYHMMATPEWEELNITHDYQDDHRPEFSPLDIGSYQRPRWFVSGPFHLCVEYLLAERSERNEEADRLWGLLMASQACDLPVVRSKSKHHIIAHSTLEQKVRNTIGAFVLIPYRCARFIWSVLGKILGVSGGASRAIKRNQWLSRQKWIQSVIRQSLMTARRVESNIDFTRMRLLVSDFKALFPARVDILRLADFSPYLQNVARLNELFDKYDIIQGYGTDPILPLISGNRPFVAFEHGTLRDFIRNDDPTNRLTALAYRKADHVFVTNGDCLQHAHWLGVENPTAMVHPVDINQHHARNESAINAVRERYDADVLLFCPIRHDWSVKGTDVHIRALPEIRRLVKGRVKLVLAPWGLQIEDSRRLIKQLGCEDMIAWLERPLCRLELISYMQAADVVLDQMALPHFGATAPQALAAGTPVIMSYKPESTAWIVDEPAPIISALTPEEVARGVATAIDPAWRADFHARARTWIDKHHHQDRLIRDHLRVYQNILERSDVERRSAA